MIFNIKISLFIICPCDMKVTLYNFYLCLQIKNPQMEAKFVLELGQKVVHLFVCLLFQYSVVELCNNGSCFWFLHQGAVIIHEVNDGGAAQRDGRLQAGDQILEV